MKFHHISLFRYFESAALCGGGWKTGVISTYWDISRKCENPVVRQIQGAVPIAQGRTGSRYIDINVPCRKCIPCLKYRAWLWRTRAQAEMLHSTRTWFCTFTLNPDARTLFLFRASNAKGDLYRWEDLAAEVGKEFTKYLKRLRKSSKCKLRYLLVFEEHKDGWPHLHVLIHEQAGSVTKRQIQAHWPYGFSNVKICDISASFYVTKYLAKTMRARVRASIRYGQINDLSS